MTPCPFCGKPVVYRAYIIEGLHWDCNSCRVSRFDMCYRTRRPGADESVLMPEGLLLVRNEQEADGEP